MASLPGEITVLPAGVRKAAGTPGISPQPRKRDRGVARGRLRAGLSGGGLP